MKKYSIYYWLVSLLGTAIVWLMPMAHEITLVGTSKTAWLAAIVFGFIASVYLYFTYYFALDELLEELTIYRAFKPNVTMNIADILEISEPQSLSLLRYYRRYTIRYRNGSNIEQVSVPRQLLNFTSSNLTDDLKKLNDEIVVEDNAM